jgi:type II secretory pathway component PulJ
MRPSHGFSLAEALVALVLTSIVLVAAGAFFAALGRHADREAGRSPGVGGPTDAAIARLERDLTLAESLPRRAGRRHADSRTLLLELQDGSVVAWTQDGSRLMRGVQDDRHRFDDKLVLDRLRFVDLRPRSERLFEIGLSRRDEPVRRRTVLLRNLDTGPSDDDPEAGP